jgi:hypothetical protein
MSKEKVADSTDSQLLDELLRVRKLLILGLVAQGVRPSTIGKALGVTAASAVRALVPVKSIPRKAKEKKA